MCGRYTRPGKLAHTIEEMHKYREYVYWESRKHSGKDLENDCWQQETPLFGQDARTYRGCTYGSECWKVTYTSSRSL